jgi:two-component system chemotaxis sensor kinase CheA
MGQKFDINEEELPIFLAESEEQLRVLEKGLVLLERERENPELVQALFRAAHTLKGSAGMISHKRMVELTHTLETVLDGVRKKKILVDPKMIDTCLESLDHLHSLCDEVSSNGTFSSEVSDIVAKLSCYTEDQGFLDNPIQNLHFATEEIKLSEIQERSSLENGDNQPILVHAMISPDSIASAARAFQIVLALQELGDIQSMQPTLEVIETAAPVSEFKAWLRPSKSLGEIKKSLGMISEVDQLTIGEVSIQPDQKYNQDEVNEQANSPRLPLGEILVMRGLITPEQLRAALDKQQSGGPAAPIGQILVAMNYINQEVLDEIIAEQSHQKKAIQLTTGLAGSERSSPRSVDKTIRTSVERLDKLMNLIGELITDRNRMYQLRRQLADTRRVSEDIEALSETITHVGRITDLLQTEVMGIRMLPISNVFNKFPRLVRDLTRKSGKQVDLVIRGEDTELDRSVIEEISDPLIHLIRNAVDHGIELPKERVAAGKPERGIILLTARHEQGRIIITVEDNGKGIDIERVKEKAVEKGELSKSEAEVLTDEEAIDLIFVSGLSTTREVSDVSGRGVGMDIVRNNIERLNGNILVDSWMGSGTRFSIILPLTLAIVPTLLVEVWKITFAIPLVMVSEIIRIKASQIQTINSKAVILLRNSMLPVNRLAVIFNLPSSPNGYPNDHTEYIVILRSGKTQMGLIVDDLIGQQELVVKSLSPLVGEVSGISSAAILGDGQVALIIDVQGLFKLVMANNETNIQSEWN